MRLTRGLDWLDERIAVRERTHRAPMASPGRASPPMPFRTMPFRTMPFRTMRISIFLAFLLAVGCGGSSSGGAVADNGAAGQEAASSGDEHHGEHHGEHHHGAHHGEHHAEAPPEPSRVMDDGSRLFGGDLDAAREVTSLAEIIASPDQYEGQVVKTEGEIAQVCQAMGCWMEIRTDENSPGIRVPMAGHSFFLPRDLAGSRATIEGTVHVAALSDEEREHLASEGATATDQDVSIEATGVLVAP